MTETFIPTDPTDLMAFLHSQRLFEGHGQQDMADVLGTVQSQLSDWERGAKQPKLAHAMTWANALGFRVALVPFESEVTS